MCKHACDDIRGMLNVNKNTCVLLFRDDVLNTKLFVVNISQIIWHNEDDESENIIYALAIWKKLRDPQFPLK